uniref:Rieske (Fe-S) domain containing n=1 Tax=Salmo trutta TaxID=8032 RepID=A0A673ZCV5_SALTR
MEEREERQEPATGSHFVGKKEDLIKAKRSFRTVEGRDILVLCHQEIFYALDFHCYHAGGPLQNGDIEEFDGKLCIVCPKHKFKISLAKGESIYRATNPYDPVPTPRWYSKAQDSCGSDNKMSADGLFSSGLDVYRCRILI